MDHFIFETPFGGVFVIVLLILAAIAAWGAIRPSQNVAFTETVATPPRPPRAWFWQGRASAQPAEDRRNIVSEPPFIPEPCKKEKEENERLTRDLLEKERIIREFQQKIAPTPQPEPPAKLRLTASQLEFQQLPLQKVVKRFHDHDPVAAERLYSGIVAAQTDWQRRQNTKAEFTELTDWCSKKGGEAIDADLLWAELVDLTLEKEQQRVKQAAAAEKRESEQRLLRERAPFIEGKLNIMLMRFRANDETNQNALWNEAVKADPQLENVRDAFDAFSNYATKRGAKLPDEATLWQQMVEYFKARDEVGIRKRILRNALRSFQDGTEAPEVLRLALRNGERFKQLTGQLPPGPTTTADVDALDGFLKHLVTTEPELIFEDKSEILPLLQQANEKLDKEEALYKAADEGVPVTITASGEVIPVATEAATKPEATAKEEPEHDDTEE